MSIPPRRDTKYAAKRRAATRRRIRDLGRNLFAYLIVGILIIGTIATVFVARGPAVAPAPVPAITPSVSAGLSPLVTQADQAAATGNYTMAVGLYSAYISQNPQNAQDADVLYKLGKAYVSPQNPSPDYMAGLQALQHALSINPHAPWAADAISLIAQYQSKVPTAGQPVTGTATITNSATPTRTGTTGAIPSPGGVITSPGASDVVPTAPVTGTRPITP